MTDGSGNSVASYGYDVFGAIRSQSGSSDHPWLFTGEQLDADSDMYYLRARYYDPATGRFLSQDPVTAVNLYAYVRNNPLRFMDPTGEWPKISVPNPIEEIKEKVVDPVVDTVEDGAGEASDFFTDTLPRAAECTWEQTAKAGDWLYRKAIVPTINFLGSCEGKLLAGGIILAGAGVSGIGFYYWSANAALAAGTLEGVHAATELGWVAAGSTLVGGLGVAAIIDACFGSELRYSHRVEAASQGPGKE
jgi:RHS repeat-associated protein